MVDYRPMVNNIDPLAALKMVLAPSPRARALIKNILSFVMILNRLLPLTLKMGRWKFSDGRWYAPYIVHCPLYTAVYSVPYTAFDCCM